MVRSGDDVVMGWAPDGKLLLTGGGDVVYEGGDGGVWRTPRGGPDALAASLTFRHPEKLAFAEPCG